MIEILPHVLPSGADEAIQRARSLIEALDINFSNIRVGLYSKLTYGYFDWCEYTTPEQLFNNSVRSSIMIHAFNVNDFSGTELLDEYLNMHYSTVGNYISEICLRLKSEITFSFFEMIFDNEKKKLYLESLDYIISQCGDLRQYAK